MSKLKLTRKLAFTIHSWLGLTSGVFLLLLGLSGSALVFLKEIDHVLNAELLEITPGKTTLSLDQIYRKIDKVHPKLAGLAWLNPEAEPNEAYEFRLYQNDGSIRTYDLGMLSMNPYNGKILRDGNLKNLNPSLMYWIFQFHWSFQLGIPGLLLATIFGLSMLLSSVTGLIIYRKYVWKVLTFKVKVKWDNWRTTTSGLHRILGVWALFFNVIIFFTGFWMNMFSLDPTYWKKQTVSCPVSTLSSQNIDTMFTTAKKRMPDLVVKNIYFPTQPGKDFRVSGPVRGQSSLFYNGNSVAIDSKTGNPTSVDRLTSKGISDKLAAMVLPLHVGNFGGVLLKVFYVILGLMPGLLSITGALLWWRKVKSRQNKLLIRRLSC
jgi:uncharacterized iron-regulated membrane protein